MVKNVPAHVRQVVAQSAPYQGVDDPNHKYFDYAMLRSSIM